MQEQQMSSEKLNHQIDFMLALIEQTVISGIAGWLAYLEKEKGVVAGAGHDIEDDETIGATPPASEDDSA